MQISNDVLQKLKSDPEIRNGDVDKVVALVNSDVLPSVDLARMTATATATTGGKRRPCSERSWSRSSGSSSYGPTQGP
jgi:phospholipid transport system substrate-binding protein